MLTHLGGEGDDDKDNVDFFLGGADVLVGLPVSIGGLLVVDLLNGALLLMMDFVIFVVVVLTLAIVIELVVALLD